LFDIYRAKDKVVKDAVKGFLKGRLEHLIKATKSV